jgi:hypothetical protein
MFQWKTRDAFKPPSPRWLAPAQASTPFIIINADQSHHKYRIVSYSRSIPFLHFSISKFLHSVILHLYLYRRLGGFVMPLVPDICQ